MKTHGSGQSKQAAKKKQATVILRKSNQGPVVCSMPVKKKWHPLGFANIAITLPYHLACTNSNVQVASALLLLAISFISHVQRYYFLQCLVFHNYTTS
jgi:hypothetical protein